MAYRKTERERERLARRRSDIVDAGLAVVRHLGFTGAKARDVAETAGVSVGSLYSNFDGIDDLHAEVFGTLAERELRRVADDVERADGPRAALTALVHGFGARCLAAPTTAWALLLEPAGPTVEALRLRYRRDHADLAASVIREGMSTGDFGPQVVEVTAPAVVGAIAEAMVRPLRPGPNPEPPPTAHSIDEIARFCLRAVDARTPRTGPTTPGRTRHPVPRERSEPR